MDGDSSAKTMDKGAASAAIAQNLEDGMPEVTKPRGEPAGVKTTGTGTSAFDASGAIGKQFTTGGMLGGAAQKVGGPFDKDGAIGKAFTPSGSIGGSVQDTLAKGENTTFQK
ncbi:hypothetical protein AAFC00_002645 [Neodothiora populina]|uniref:Uncharacterized protein n=1 Tax=Neodothiora populina TaxID=2781224 RepID=A0ABR3P7Q7_9PEZI